MVEETNIPSSSDGEIQADSSVNNLGDENGTEENDIAERGKGHNAAQARISELVSEVKSTKEELAEMKRKLDANPNSSNQPTPPASPNVQKAVEYLKSLGFTQKSDVEKEVQSVRDRMALDSEHMRLRGNYAGEDGRPAYNQAEVEKYMREQGIYNPEVAYKAMHEAELLDWSLKKANSNTKKPFIEKPGSSAGSREDSTITRDKIEEWMKTPEGRMKYEENRDKILQMMSEGKL